MTDQVPQQKYSRNIHHLALATTFLTVLTDSTELYIPSVLTLQVTCDLDLNHQQEFLAVMALYIALAFATFLSIPISDYLGRRVTFIVSIYMSIISTVVCSVVPDYISLLASRILIGLSVGLNDMVNSVYIAEITTNKDFYRLSITWITIALSLGGGWAGFLAYFFLDRLGWRYFLLTSSLPLFIFPLVSFHFFLPETKPPHTASANETSRLIPDNKVEIALKASTIRLRITKLCGVGFFSFCVYYAGILLLPLNIQEYNLSTGANLNVCGSVYGSQFLILTAIFGGCNLLGRFTIYTLQKYFSSASVLTISALVCLSQIILINILPSNHSLFFTSIGVINIFGDVC